MDWSAETLYAKAKLYASRAHNEPIQSPLFGFWMSLALELIARAALASVHPALLADPKEPDNIHYAFGVQPKGTPKSIPAKAVFARCSIMIPDFTDKMSGHGLLMADKRNAELHSGAAAFEGLENSAWLPATYELIEVLLRHMKRDFADFLGAHHAELAGQMLRNRRNTIRNEVQTKLAAARKAYAARPADWKQERAEKIKDRVAMWLRTHRLAKVCVCPACKQQALLNGETVSRSPVRVDEEAGTISREVRILPNEMACPHCLLKLNDYQEVREAGLGAIYQNTEEEDPIDFFGIVPEDHVDMEKLMQDYIYQEYNNE